MLPLNRTFLTAALLAPVALIAVEIISTPAHAAPRREPRMLLELQGGPYKPDVDAGFNGATPWRNAFGSKGLTLLRGEFDYQFLRGFGSLGIGIGAGYGWVDGVALDADGEATKDEIGFNVAPFSVSLVYRFDWMAVEHGVPLVPYAKAGLSTWFWWSTDAKDNISVTRNGDGTSRRGTGVTFGWHVAGGLMFLLDVFSASMAASLDDETGVQNSYLFAEFIYNDVNDFGSSTSINLSESTFSFGLAFEF
jgi:hypothetical protein